MLLHSGKNFLVDTGPYLVSLSLYYLLLLSLFRLLLCFSFMEEMQVMFLRIVPNGLDFFLAFIKTFHAACCGL